MSLEVKDLLLADMAAHQRVIGQEVTAEENDRLVVPVFEQLEHKRARAKPAPFVADKRPRHEVAKANAKKRAEETGRAPWDLRELPEKDLADIAAISPFVLECIDRLWPRVQLLMSKTESGPLGAPSWADRVTAVLGLYLAGQPMRHVVAELMTLAEASNETFGDWKKDPPKALHFT